MHRLLAFPEVHKEVTVAVIRPDIVSEGKVDEVIEKVRILYCYCLQSALLCVVIALQQHNIVSLISRHVAPTITCYTSLMHACAFG